MSAGSEAPDPEVELLRRARAGDGEAAQRLLERHRDALRRFCRGYLAGDDAVDDAMQEILVKLLAARNAPERLRPWLYRVARNHCLNAARGRRRRRDAASIASDAELAASATGPLTALQRAERREELARRLDRLTEAERELLRLRYEEDLPREEIAEVLGVSASLVKSRLYEAVAKLREGAGGRSGPL
jgi:RNA polymerase sigma-70 factor (ECF subfamily)